MELKHLVKKAKKGDKEALLQLILKEKDNYYRLAYTYMKNQVDMVQDMIITLFDSIKSLRKFDTIPKETKEIELVLDEITVSQNIGKEFSITEGQEIEVLQNIIQIDQIEKRDERTFITITTEEGTRIPGVNLIADGSSYELLETSESSYEKKQDEMILNTRTLEFEGTGDELKLFIGDIRYTKKYELTVYKESKE